MAYFDRNNGLSDHVDFNNMIDVDKKIIVEYIIKECLVIAGKYDGKVYGGFVRDVIVPTENQQQVLKWKDVDIYFSESENSELFVKEMGRKLKPYNFPNPNEYPWKRSQYHLYLWDVCVAWIDVIVSKNFPVNDFHVNHLVYCYRPSNLLYSSIWGDIEVSVEGKVKKGTTVGNLKICINTKIARMDREHIDLLSDPINGPNRIDRIKKRYIERGWKVFVGTKELKCDKPWDEFVKELKDDLYKKFLADYSTGKYF